MDSVQKQQGGGHCEVRAVLKGWHGLALTSLSGRAQLKGAVWN